VPRLYSAGTSSTAPSTAALGAATATPASTPLAPAANSSLGWTNSSLVSYFQCLGFRVQGFRVHGFKSSRVQGFKGSRVQGFKGSRVHGFKGSRVQGFEGSRVQCVWFTLAAPVPTAPVATSTAVSSSRLALGCAPPHRMCGPRGRVTLTRSHVTHLNASLTPLHDFHRLTAGRNAADHLATFTHDFSTFQKLRERPFGIK
jgi:hypothetical protein